MQNQGFSPNKRTDLWYIHVQIKMLHTELCPEKGEKSKNAIDTWWWNKVETVMNFQHARNRFTIYHFKAKNALSKQDLVTSAIRGMYASTNFLASWHNKKQQNQKEDQPVNQQKAAFKL